MNTENNLNTKAYGAKLAAARDALGLSQSEAGKRLGKARETLSLIERGSFTYAPSPREMQAYEDLYGIPVIEQLSTLGYEVNALCLEGLGEVTAEEVVLLNTARSLEPAVRRLGIRLLHTLSSNPAGEN